MGIWQRFWNRLDERERKVRLLNAEHDVETESETYWRTEFFRVQGENIRLREELAQVRHAYGDLSAQMSSAGCECGCNHDHPNTGVIGGDHCILCKWCVAKPRRVTTREEG